MTEPKREFAPYISLSTALSIAGNELVEMAGAINEREVANENKLNRAHKAAHKALDAIGEYYRIMDATKLDPPRYVSGSSGPHARPSSHKQAGVIPSPAMQGDDMLPLATMAALNGDDTPPEGEAA